MGVPKNEKNKVKDEGRLGLDYNTMTSTMKFMQGCLQCSHFVRHTGSDLFANHVVLNNSKFQLGTASSIIFNHRNFSISNKLLITRKRNALPPPPLLQPEMDPPRPGDTIVVERLWQLPPGPDGGRPHRSQMNELYKLLKVVDGGIKYPEDMPCILTEFIDGIGIRGDVVSVKRDLFHNELFPGGLAVYASPENIEEFEEERRAAGIEKAESRLGVLARMTMKELNNMSLEIPLREDIDWTLNKKHVQVAFRLQGIEIDVDCIEIPEEAVTGFGEVKISVSINDIETVEMTANIVSVLEKFPPSKK